MSALKALALRFREPSSWAGITGLVAIVGYHLDPGLAQAITFIGAGIAGFIAFFIPEQGKPQ